MRRLGRDAREITCRMLGTPVLDWILGFEALSCFGLFFLPPSLGYETSDITHEKLREEKLGRAVLARNPIFETLDHLK